MSRNFHNIHDYESALQYLTVRGVVKSERRLHGRSTVLRVLDSESIAVRYHYTNIVTYFRDGSVALNSDGYRTVTTKAKINEYAPKHFSLSQSKGVWYVCSRRMIKDSDGKFDHYETISSGIFADNMVIKANGKMSGILKPEASKKTLKLAKQINAYARKYVDALIAGKVKAPSSGDCWYCAMITNEDAPGYRHMGSDVVPTKKTLGDSIGDNSHLLTHVKESYFVPSLAVNACETMGASIMTKATINRIWYSTDLPSSYIKPENADSPIQAVFADLMRNVESQPEFKAQREDAAIQWLRRDLVSIIRRYLRLKLAIGN